MRWWERTARLLFSWKRACAGASTRPAGIDLATPRKSFKKLSVRRFVQAFPRAKWASDQAYREYDLAIDICEDVRPWPQEDVDGLLELCQSEGAHAKLSSIHVNTWFGEYDKKAGLKHWLAQGAPGLDAILPEMGRAAFHRRFAQRRAIIRKLPVLRRSGQSGSLPGSSAASAQLDDRCGKRRRIRGDGEPIDCRQGPLNRMDNVSHSLAALALGELACRLPSFKPRLEESNRFRPAVLLTSLFANNLPDVDTIGARLFQGGGLNMLVSHRGLTHSFFFVPLGAMMAAGAGLFLFRKSVKPGLGAQALFCRCHRYPDASLHGFLERLRHSSVFALDEPVVLWGCGFRR